MVTIPHYHVNRNYTTAAATAAAQTHTSHPRLTTISACAAAISTVWYDLQKKIFT